MNVRRINQLLWAAAGGLAAAAVAVAIAGLVLPLESDGVGDVVGRSGDAGPATEPAGGRLPLLAEFAPVWGVQLRGPVAAAPPPAAEATAGDVAPPGPAPAGLPPLALVGTIGDVLAMVRSPDGTVEVRAVGEAVAPAAVVVAVRPAEVDVRYNGRVVTLRRTAEGVPAGGGAVPPSAPGSPAPGDPSASPSLTVPTDSDPPVTTLPPSDGQPQPLAAPGG